MSWTDQKPFTVTADHLRLPFGGHRDGRNFRCAWCGHRFEAGDVARWVYTNGSDETTKGISGNPFICARCDGPRDEILARLRAMADEFCSERLWWFRRRQG